VPGVTAAIGSAPVDGSTPEKAAPAELTLQTFAPAVGETFAVDGESGATVELILAEAAPHEGGPASPQEPFSLLFHGPADPLLPQATYRFQHGELGAMEIFIVPLGRDEHSAVYEAVFG
jgi:hypothetical protein